MGNIFLMSDTHFGHDKDFIYKPRGFQSVQEMNETILSNCLKTVKADDDFYLLGDLMLGDFAESSKLVAQLPGKLHIVLGNHDTANRIKFYEELPQVVSVGYGDLLKVGKKSFFLSHYVTETGNFDSQHIPYNICGHVHTDNKFLDMDRRSYHVEPEAHNNTPVSIEEIILDIKSYKIK